MGREAHCVCRWDEQASEGKAHLDSTSLAFRGDFRLVIPLKAITSIEARDGRLSLTYSGRVAMFELGKAAETWAAKITKPKSLLDKLGVKPSARISVVGPHDDGFLQQLSERTTQVATTPQRDADVVFLAADRLDELKSLRKLKGSIKPDGAIWVVSLKGKQARLKDTDVMAAAREAGLVDNKVVAFSDTHTALKLVIPKAARAR